MDTKGDKSIIFLINFHRYDITFKIFSRSTNSLNVATNLMGELPLDSNVTLPRDLYDQELIRSTCPNLKSGGLYFDYQEKDQVVSVIFDSIKYIFQNKTENDLHTYVSTVRLKMARRDDHVDILSILTDFRSVGVDGDGLGGVGNQQQLDPAPGTENIQEERHALDGVEVIGDGVSGVENQQQLDQASETEINFEFQQNYRKFQKEFALVDKIYLQSYIKNNQEFINDLKDGKIESFYNEKFKKNEK